MSEISQKQLEANKENAKLGGVKTEEGKAVSKYNALKHGILSKEVLLKGEDEKTLIELGKKLRTELKPETELELLLIDRIVTNFWRLKRAMMIEKDEVIYIDDDSIPTGLKGDADIFFRYETMIERGIYKALHELQRIQAARAGEKPPLPVVIDVDVSKE